ncbi:MAG: VWA domain-containing protein [Bryobacteraceae bacterium]
MGEPAVARAAVLGLALVAYVFAEAAGQPPAPAAAVQNQPEISTREEPAKFTSRVNLVMVPVVVRDNQGRTIEGLTKESFRLYDKGKLQEIERFLVERSAGAGNAAPSEGAAAGKDAATADRGAPAGMPRRFIGYLFDDVHSEFADLAQAREAAERHIYADLGPTDRAAIFTTSGQGQVDFTDELAKLRQALQRLLPHPIGRAAGLGSQGMSFYQADMIVNYHDPLALAAAVGSNMDRLDWDEKTGAVEAEARRILSIGQQGTQVSLAVIRDVIRRMSALPGERVLILVSPGFYTLPEHQFDEYDVIDHALRANVVINALNPKGVYAPLEGFDASRPSVSAGGVSTVKIAFERQTDMVEEGTLMGFTAGTGGYYFHNNNDLAAGFRRTAAAPELYYLLGFQPQNLKLDGSFHGLKVTIEPKAGYSIEARHGYFAPSRLQDAAATAKREIEDAVYSREEMSDLPITMHTQFLKGAGDAATVTVLAHVDLAGVKFRQEGGRSLDNVTVVSALFDRNGNLVAGRVKHVDLRLRDESLQYRLAHGITVRIGLEAKPGAYAVRLVVRDSEGSLMSAINGTVDIP